MGPTVLGVAFCFILSNFVCNKYGKFCCLVVVRDKMKAKGQVRLRRRKMKGGGWSLYLDIYRGGMRRYEYLRLYLNEGRSPAERMANEETMRIAEAVRSRRNIELQRMGAAMPMPSEKTVRALLLDYLEGMKGKREGTLEVWRCWVHQVCKWKGAEVSLKDLGAEWWRRYQDYVRGRGLSPTTEHYYLSRMRSVLNRAENVGDLLQNPSKNTRIPSIRRGERIYLTADELKKMKADAGANGEIGRAFLFGCFTGLRYSDIRALRWEDIQGRRIAKKIVKTGRFDYLDLNAQAEGILGERGTGLVFGLGMHFKTVERYLRKWAESAGIGKHITFHTSRHTFAVLMLSAGVDIYTLSRLLGHSSVTTTQIYADIVDARRREAVDLFPEI